MRKAPPAGSARPGTAAARSAPQGEAAAPAAPGGVAAAPAPANLQRLAQRRAAFPHEVYGRGFDPAHSMGSRFPRAHVDLFQQMRQRAARRALAAQAAPGGVVPAGEASVPGQDTVRIGILRVDFLADRGGDKSTGDGRFDLSPRDTINRPLDPTPHDRAFFAAQGEAMRRYYRDQFAGRVVLEFSVFPAESDSAFHLTDMADYGPWKFSTDIYGAAVKLFHDCIVAADTSGENIPWHDFDRLCIIHAGSDLQSDVNTDSPEDIPTFTLGVADTDAVVVGPAKADTVFGCTIGPESIRQDGFEGVINAVFTHEFGHLVFGFRDVYDVVSGLPTVGYWSLMDTGNLVGNSVTFPNGTAVYAVGILPPAVDPWQKRLVYDDVPTAPEPVYGASNDLPDIERNFTVRKVPISGEEYLLIENRLDDLNGNQQLTLERDPATGVILGPSPADTMEYDFLVPGPGALVWHVDESVADFFGPRADPGFGLNVNPARRGLEIIEGDGLDDLGDFNTPFPLGASTDPWYVGNATSLNDTTVPKLVTNSGTDPHLDLEFTSPPGPTMTFSVTRQWDLPGWPVKVRQDAHGVAPVVARLGPNGIPCVVWSAADSCVHARRGDGSPLVPGAPDDVVFRGAGPLLPVAVVEASPQQGGAFLAIGVDSVSGSAESDVHFVHFQLSGALGGDESIHETSPLTAGPCADEAQAGAPADAYVGLASGEVVRATFAASPDGHLVGAGPVATLTGRVTGLAVRGAGLTAGLYAASAGGDVVASSGEVLGGTLPAGHDYQPIVFDLLQPNAARRLAVVDRTIGALHLYDIVGPAIGGAEHPTPLPLDQNHPLGEPIGPPALADVDGDGLPEILFTTASGRVGYWNDNGSLSPGWPPNVEHEPFPSVAGPLPLAVPNGGPSYLLASLGNGVLVGMDAQRRRAPGFPLGMSVGARGTGALDTGLFLADGPAVLFVAGGDSLLYGIGLYGLGLGQGAPIADWTAEGGSASRAYAAAGPFGVGPAITDAASPILPGTLKIYPNPARQAPVTFAFRLRQAGQVTVKIFDTAARQVASFRQAGSASDNAITWDPGSHPSGLYVARVEVPGQVVTLPFAILR